MEKRGESTNQMGMHAVLVGCNYPTKPPVPGGRLDGCDNDVLMMRKTLIRRFGFDPNRIVTMVDSPAGSKGKMPTGQNIKKALYEMIGKAQRGDRLFFHFSGHGVCDSEDVVKFHAIVATDDNVITPVDFRDMVIRLPEKATFTILADSCCAGGLIDKEPVQVGPPYHKLSEDDDDDQTTIISSENNNQPSRMITYESFVEQLSSRTGINDPDIGVHQLQLFGSEASLMFRLPAHQHPRPLKPDEGILLSGSEPNKISYGGGVDENGVPCSAFTKAVVGIVKRHPGPITNRELVNKARGILGKDKKYPQHPCLYCSKKNADAAFLGKPSARAEIGETSSQDDETEHASE